jgi:putative flippase GtrA
MTTTALRDAGAQPLRSLDWSKASTVLDIVIPVYNEETDLPACVRRLHAHLRDAVPFSAQLTIVDNASTDGTLAVARRLELELPRVRVMHLPEKGRGRALRAAWTASDAPIVAYMDVDLSTDLAALLPLVAPLISGHSDIAIGSRLNRSSRVIRGPKREIISRCYKQLLHRTLGTRFADAQCGFKAIRSEVAAALMPLVEDNGWFFDTEMLVIAEHSGLRIHEVPVDWIDDANSSVDIWATAVADLKGVLRVGRALANGSLALGALRGSLGRGGLLGARPLKPETQSTRFAAIGAVSTIAYALLFWALQPVVGSVTANVLAMLVTAVLNTEANRRLTFGRCWRYGAVRQHLRGLGLFLPAAAITGTSLSLLHHVNPTAGRITDLVFLTAVNVLVTVARFPLMRHWVFRSPNLLTTPPAGSSIRLTKENSR